MDMESNNEQLKLKEIDQLHASILQFSNNTLSTKKFCATVLIAVVTVILKITGDKLDNAIYVGGLITILIFWIIDANSYYYQRLLRIRMKKIVSELTNNELISGFGMPLKQNEDDANWTRAFFNNSQIFYLLAFFALVGSFLCDIFGFI